MLKKKIILYITVLSFIICNISNNFVVPVKADTVDIFIENLHDAERLSQEVAQYFANAMPVPDEKRDELYKKYCTITGFIVGPVWFTAANIYDSFWGQILPSGDTIDGTTAQDVSNQITQKLVEDTTITDTTIHFGEDAKKLLELYANLVQNTTGYKYVYDVNMLNYATVFPDAYYYNALRHIVDDNKNEYYFCWQWNHNRLILYPRQLDCDFVLHSYSYNTPFVITYDYNTWEYVNMVNYDDILCYSYDSTNHEFVSSNKVSDYTSGFVSLSPTGEISFSPNSRYSYFICFSNTVNVHKMYNTLNDFKNASIGVSPYYVSNIYNGFVNNGTVTYDSSNSNNISYNNVQDYVNSFNTTNGSYPDPTEINIFIDNNIPQTTPTPSPTPNPDNPGSGETGDDTESIFDWLSKIGSLIGNLISGVGGFIAGVLEGVVNALTSILDTITSIITTITTSIPDNFNTLMTTILGWLPEEWTAVISAFLLVSLLVGLFKLFRG